MTTKYTKGHEIVFSVTIDELLVLKQCVDHAIKMEHELKDMQKTCEPIEDKWLQEMSMSVHPATCEVSIDGETYKVGFLPQLNKEERE